jgi:hypothetical protein
MTLTIDQARNILQAGQEYNVAQDAMLNLIDDYTEGRIEGYDEDVVSIVEKFLASRAVFESTIMTRGLIVP